MIFEDLPNSSRDTTRQPEEEPRHFPEGTEDKGRGGKQRQETGVRGWETIVRKGLPVGSQGHKGSKHGHTCVYQTCGNFTTLRRSRTFQDLQTKQKHQNRAKQKQTTYKGNKNPSDLGSVFSDQMSISR